MIEQPYLTLPYDSMQSKSPPPKEKRHEACIIFIVCWQVQNIVIQLINLLWPAALFFRSDLIWKYYFMEASHEILTLYTFFLLYMLLEYNVAYYSELDCVRKCWSIIQKFEPIDRNSQWLINKYLLFTIYILSVWDCIIFSIMQEIYISFLNLRA